MTRQTRSQRPPQASQSRPPRATQAGRSRRAQVEEEPEEEQGAQEAHDEDEGEGDKVQGVSRLATPLQPSSNEPLSRLQEIEKKARDLVRLALFNEQRRMPLRRDEISKKGALRYCSDILPGR